ncbi:MAG TPA: hypothetical protein VI729_00385 [Anaerolineales bacterium]|nr:hypothetical protein [Anaerolineales bacterium]
MTALGDPPNYAALPASFWDDQTALMSGALTPLLQEVYMASAEAALEVSPVGVDWVVVNQRAVTWANQYGYDLVQGLTGTQRDLTREAVGNFFSQNQTLSQLRDRLEGAFGPIRADMIATTEVTRAATEGERALVNLLTEQGLAFRDIWETSADELVCPRCAPLDGQERGPTGYIHPDGTVYDGPPDPHPRCRCRERHESIL